MTQDESLRPMHFGGYKLQAKLQEDVEFWREGFEQKVSCLNNKDQSPFSLFSKYKQEKKSSFVKIGMVELLKFIHIKNLVKEQISKLYLTA